MILRQLMYITHLNTKIQIIIKSRIEHTYDMNFILFLPQQYFVKMFTLMYF